MSNLNHSSLSPNAQQFLALLSNAAVMAKLTGGPSTRATGGLRGVKEITSSSQYYYTYHDPGDRILQLPIAHEDQLFSFYEEMKAQFAKDSVRF